MASGDDKGSWGNQAGYKDQWNKKGPGEGSGWENLVNETKSIFGGSPASSPSDASSHAGDPMADALSRRKAAYEEKAKG